MDTRLIRCQEVMEISSVSLDWTWVGVYLRTPRKCQEALHQVVEVLEELVLRQLTLLK